MLDHQKLRHDVRLVSEPREFLVAGASRISSLPRAPFHADLYELHLSWNATHTLCLPCAYNCTSANEEGECDRAATTDLAPVDAVVDPVDRGE